MKNYSKCSHEFNVCLELAFISLTIFKIVLKNKMQQQGDMMNRFHFYQFSSFTIYFVEEIKVHIFAGSYYDVL